MIKGGQLKGKATYMASIGMHIADHLEWRHTEQVQACKTKTVFAEHAEPLPYLVGFGEEYELLFTASPTNRELVQSTGHHFGTTMTRIGRIHANAERGAELTHRDWPTPLFAHFAESHR